MTKKFWTLFMAAALAVGVLAGCSKKAAAAKKKSEDAAPAEINLAAYAPEGADGISYINGKNIFRTKIFTAYRKTLAYENMVKKARKEGIDLDEVVQGELCAFGDMSKLSGDMGMIRKGHDYDTDFVYRGPGRAAENLFGLLAKAAKMGFESEKRRFEQTKEERGENASEMTAPGYSADDIAGKRAVTYRSSHGVGGTAILLDGNTLQLTVSVGKKGGPAAAPLQKGSSELARKIDTNALFCIFQKIGKLPPELTEMLNSDDAKLYRDILIDLKSYTANACEIGDDLELKVVGEYGSDEAATRSCETLIALRKLGQEALRKEKDSSAAVVVRILDAIDIERNGATVTIRLKYGQDEFVKLIGEWDREERELAKNRK